MERDLIETLNVNNTFTIKCNKCGKEIKFKDCFQDDVWEGIDIFELFLGGVVISCECGNKIKSREMY